MAVLKGTPTSHHSFWSNSETPTKEPEKQVPVHIIPGFLKDIPQGTSSKDFKDTEQP